MKYKNIEILGASEEILKSDGFVRAVEEVLEIIQEQWENECSLLEINNGSVVGHTPGNAKIRIQIK